MRRGRISCTTRRLAAASLLCLAASAGGYSTRHEPGPQNIVLVTLDTTRADRLGLYGDASATTPVLDRLAREGVVFDRVESVAPLTLPAHCSLFTGLYPPHHGVRDNGDEPLDARHGVVAERLRARGLRTAAFVGSAVLAANRGLARGFDVYSDGRRPDRKAPHRRLADQVIDDALAWLDTVATQPFFLWVHLYDPHANQTLPDAYRARFAGDPYAGAIAFADAQVGRLLDRLDQRRTAIVVAGDHGESLGDHGEEEHGIFLYESTLHVPLIIRAPQIDPHRVSALISLADVAPTILDLMHLEAPRLDGRSLLPLLKDRGALPERVVYAESMYARRFGWSPLRVLRDERFKLIDAPRPELYDLDVDPFEAHNLAIEQPTVGRAMRSGLGAMFRNQDDGASAGRTELPAADIGALLALGYVSGSPPTPTTLGRDPKDFIEEYNAIRRRRMMR